MTRYPQRGEIFLVKLANKPSDPKQRPALIVSLDVRNRLAEDVIVVPISTTRRVSPTHVELLARDSGLHHDSMVKCEQVTTLDKALVLSGPIAGKIGPDKMREVERAIMRAIGVP